MKLIFFMAFFGVFLFVAESHRIRSDWKDIPPAYEAPEYQFALKNILRRGKIPLKPNGGRIINGYLASMGQFPHQVLKFMQAPGGNWFFCGGSIISEHWVLSAAHCLENRINVEIYAGLIDRSEDAEYYSGLLPSAAFRIHENYNPSFLDNDIALIEVISRITKTQFVNSINLPRRADAQVSLVGVPATASGFGATVVNGPGSQFLRYWEQPFAANSV